jgi:hypothetical protein
MNDEAPISFSSYVHDINSESKIENHYGVQRCYIVRADSD